METEKVKQMILTVLNTLNVVEVKGRETMNKMLGAIITLEQIVKNIDKPDEGAAMDA